MTSTTLNLLAWWEQADADQRAAGLEWYPEADALAARIADATGGRVSHRQACGVIAVLSPRCSWPDNKRAALDVVLAWGAGRSPQSVKSPGVYPENIGKAFRVLDGPADPAVCDGTRPGKRGRRIACSPTRHGCQCTVHGPKVAAFYRAIAGTAEDGCMDVWATRAARVSPAEVSGLAADDPRRHPVPTVREHAQLSRAYRRAAARVGVSARSFQAVVWLSIRSGWTRSNGTAFGARADIPF